MELTSTDFLLLADSFEDEYDFDLMIVSDGSGNTVDRPCGFYAASYEKATKTVREHFGGTNGGTNNYAELAPFLLALWQFQATFNPAGWKREVRVLCVSDSLITVNCGNGKFARNANRALWANLDWYSDNGYDFRWEHVPRNSNPINVRADCQAGKVRALFEDFE